MRPFERKNKMKTILAAIVFTAIGSVSAVRAAPPTVMPSPGYDRALADSRKARAEPVIIEPRTVSPPKRKIRRR
jgi:hypothetical protein